MSALRRLGLGLAALAAVLFTASAAAARPPIWIVRDKDSELVLFGSVHILPPGLDWRPPQLVQAMAHADDVWFELPINPDTEQRSITLARQLGVLPPGQSLFKQLPKAVADKVIEAARAYGADPAALDHFRPWLAEVALSDVAYRKAGAGGGDGVEKTLSAQTPTAADKRAFETADEQISILASGSWDEQVASLADTAQQMLDDPQQYQKLIDAWMKGDLKALDREALQPMRKVSPVLFRRILVDRNVRWVRALDARLRGHGHTVVVVGMAHLIGPDGLPARLRALGYQVQGP